MPVHRREVEARLARCPAEELAVVLQVAGLRAAEEEGAEVLARRLAAALWWRTHTPLGGALLPDQLDALLDRVERKLELRRGEGDAWQRLAALRRRLLPDGRPRGLDELDPELRRRLARTHRLAIGGLAAGTGAAAGRIAAWRLLAATTGPWWDLLPLVPKLGPVFLGLRAGAGAVLRLSGPVGLALALLSLNASFGAADDEALPLLLGIGLLLDERGEPVVVQGSPRPAVAQPDTRRG